MPPVRRPKFATPFERKPNSGAIFQNDKRKGGDDPSMRGIIRIGDDLLEFLNERKKSGQPLELSVAAWRRTTRETQKPYYSLGLRLPQEEWVRRNPRAERLEDDDFSDETEEIGDEEIPF